MPRFKSVVDATFDRVSTNTIGNISRNILLRKLFQNKLAVNKHWFWFLFFIKGHYMCALDRDLAKGLIRAVGAEYDYRVSGDLEDSVFDVYFAREKHGIAFQVRHSTHPSAQEGQWLQVHHYEGEPAAWGPALHSLRTMGDVVAFCQTLIGFSQIKSKRLA